MPVRKLDLILLPFVSVLFLLNALDKSNVGNAEAAHFTTDLGLPPEALNKSVACFFAVFVTLQPLGAALGRKYGMPRYVPICMALWGICTALHVAVRREWQLVLLRILVGTLEAGFYPTTVSYLSLFYTRYEFARRLGFFYGQAAVAGALGGLLSWAVFTHFPEETNNVGWRSWEILFLVEGVCTVFVALVGFFWLPHSTDTAWFLSANERKRAARRIQLDRLDKTGSDVHAALREDDSDRDTLQDDTDRHQNDAYQDDARQNDPLLQSDHPHDEPLTSTTSFTHDSGLSRNDIISAALDWKIWYLLVCNILSAIPATAFGIFLPLVIRGLDPKMSAAHANLLAVPPFLAGAATLWTFTSWSDRTQQRIIPTLYGLGILLFGLVAVVLLPTSAYLMRYLALTILLAGSFVASPLTVAWLTNNVPDPGKRAIVLGINGWGNLAGVIAALLFAPRHAATGYMAPLLVTLFCVSVSFVGFAAFRRILISANRRRDEVVRAWDARDVVREMTHGDVRIDGRARGWSFNPTRAGDERMTFRYSL